MPQTGDTLDTSLLVSAGVLENVVLTSVCETVEENFGLFNAKREHTNEQNC